jgi:hypothetical protein
MLSEPSIPDQITLIRRVLPAIHFDDQPLLAANEIDNVRSDWFLTDEFMPHQAARAEMTPETKLCLG